MKGISKNSGWLRELVAGVNQSSFNFESTLDAGCESSTGGTDITFKLGVIITSSRVATRGNNLSSLNGRGVFYIIV